MTRDDAQHLHDATALFAASEMLLAKMPYAPVEERERMQFRVHLNDQLATWRFQQIAEAHARDDEPAPDYARTMLTVLACQYGLPVVSTGSKMTLRSWCAEVIALLETAACLRRRAKMHVVMSGQVARA